MNATLANIPDTGTPVRITTHAGERFAGRVDHHGHDADGAPTVHVRFGAGWFVVPVADIAQIAVTGPRRCGPVVREPFSGCRPRLAFSE